MSTSGTTEVSAPGRVRGVAAACAAVGALLAGCAVGPDFRPPAPPQVDRYSVNADPQLTVPAHGVAQGFDSGAGVADEWWTQFGSPVLDDLVGQALARNPGLAAANASLRQSEAELRAGYGIFFPQAGATGSATRERVAALPAQRIPAGVFNLFTVSASVSYALDIFGGERRYVEQLGAQVEVQRETARGTYLALQANVVNTAIARAAYLAQIAATQELIHAAQQQVQLEQVRVTAGTDPYSQLLSLQSQLAQYQASIPLLQQKVTQSEDLLANLSGQEPAQWRAPQLQLAQLQLPARLPVTLPSQLVRQRPDVLAAQATLHAAGANVGVATAAMLPSVTLTGGLDTSSGNAASLFTPGAREWNLGAGVTQPLFEGGTLWFRRKAAKEAWNQAQAQYRQAVLGAFQQVADVLGALDHDASALAAQDASLQAAGDALHLVQVNYESGLATYLDVLNADTQFQQASINDIQAIAARYQDTVALYAALGGGWSEEQATAAAGKP